MLAIFTRDFTNCFSFVTTEENKLALVRYFFVVAPGREYSRPARRDLEKQHCAFDSYRQLEHERLFARVPGVAANILRRFGV
jgi:hypothetical protein